MRGPSIFHKNRDGSRTAENSVPAQAYLSVRGQSSAYHDIENGTLPFSVTEVNTCLVGHS
jgi:hypothetical protein